jgi:hypothetical protein
MCLKDKLGKWLEANVCAEVRSVEMLLDSWVVMGMKLALVVCLDCCMWETLTSSASYVGDVCVSR